MNNKVIFYLFAALCLSTLPVFAQKSVECDRVWAGPSKDNDILDCLGNSDRIASQWRYYMWPGFAALIFVFIVFGISIIYCCRCCGCCCCCDCCVRWVNPQNEGKRKRGRCWLWMWVVFSILWACGVCVLVIYGADLLMKAADNALDNFEYGTISYFNDTKSQIQELLTDNSENGDLNVDIDLSSFDDVIDKLSSAASTVRDYFKYFKIARIVSYCVGAVGVFLLLLIIIFAACRPNRWGCPCGFSAIYFFFAIIFSLLAIVFTVVQYAAIAACGEITLQYKREPGILQWYLIPYCEDEFNFTSLRATIDSEVKNAASTACSTLLDYCGVTEDYVYNDDAEKNKIFVCGQGITQASQCQTLDFLVDVIYSTYTKPILTNTVCANAPYSPYLETCTLLNCANYCVDYTSPDIPALTNAKKVSSAVSYAQNVSVALSMVTPLLQCNFIVDSVASAFQTIKVSDVDVSQCSNLKDSSIMLGCGFFVGSLMFIMAIYVMHRGSWLWPEEPKKLD